MWRELSLRQRILLGLSPLAFVGGTAIGVLSISSQPAGSATSTVTEGTIPSSLPDDPSTSALVPDYISVTSNGTIVGYIAKADMFAPAGQPVPDISSIPVYSQDLTTVVGHMVENVGYVANGATPGPTVTPIFSDPSTEGAAPSS